MALQRKQTRRETQNVAAIPRLRDLRTILTTASASRPLPRESRRAVATLGLQFQRDARAATKEERELRAMRQLFVFFEFRISDFEFRLAADPASEARKGRRQKMVRTSRSCTVR